MNKRLIVSLLLVMMVMMARADGLPEVRIAPYQGGRKAAISYTFDDGLMDQYTLARPELNKRELRATFAIVGSKVGKLMHSKQDRAMGVKGTPCMTWEMVRTLVREGHEIGNHGWEHRNVTKLDGEALRYEVEHNDSVIQQMTGVWPGVFFYPGNQKTDERVSYCEKGRIGSRVKQVSIGSQRDSVWLRHWVDGLMESGEWGIGMTHGIAGGYDHFEDASVLWRHLDYVSSIRDSLWVAPMGEVAAYVKERDNVNIGVRREGTKVVVSLSMTLDAGVYRQPVTLIIKGEHMNSAHQNGVLLRLYEGHACQMVDVVPGGGDVILE